MKKIKIRHSAQFFMKKDADVIKETYKLIKKGELKDGRKLMKTIPIEQLVEDFVNDESKLKNSTLDLIEKLIIVCKDLYSNGMTLLSDENLYDPMLNKYKLYRDEPVVENLKLSRRTVDVEHKYPELKGTLDKANVLFDKDKKVALDKSLEKFVDKLFIANGELPIKFICTLKFDGVSIVATVINGKVVLALSRGEDGKGADLTHLFKHIKFNNLADSAGVKFECVMTTGDFVKYCEEKKRKYANLRSAVVSIITRTKDTKFSKYLSLVPIQSTDIETGDYDTLNDRYSHTVTNDPWYLTAKTRLEAVNKIGDVIELTKEYRYNYRFAIDGIVVDCTNSRARNELGRKNNINQYQIAYKFEAEEAWTTAESISATVGRTGLITPMVHYDEIDFNGGKHCKSTLSSYKRFELLDLHYGDAIRVTYNNDVMPYVSRPGGSMRMVGGEKLLFPTWCPSCSSKLILDGANYFCTNRMCPSKQISSYEHFYKKLGIRNISDATVEDMLEAGAISIYSSLLDIDYHILINTEGYGEIKINDFKNQINKLKNTEIDEARLVSALGVSGEREARGILAYIDIDTILSNPNKLYELSIPNAQTKTKDKFIQGLQYMCEHIEYYKSILHVVPVKVKHSKMQVCFSGFRDKDLKSMLELIDIEVIDYKKSISYLVVKALDDDKSKGKIDKANKDGICVISKEEFAKLIREDYM